MAALQSPTINTGQLASTSKLDEPRERTGHWVHKGTDNPEKRRGNFSFGSKIRMVSAVVFNKLTKLSSFFCPEHMRYFHFLMTVCYVQLPESLSPEKNSKGFFSCWSEQGGSNHGTKCWDICSVLRGCVASCIV